LGEATQIPSRLSIQKTTSSKILWGKQTKTAVREESWSGGGPSEKLPEETREKGSMKGEWGDKVGNENNTFKRVEERIGNHAGTRPANLRKEPGKYQRHKGTCRTGQNMLKI